MAVYYPELRLNELELEYYRLRKISIFLLFQLHEDNSIHYLIFIIDLLILVRINYTVWPTICNKSMLLY
jgi:hypothetical protein